MSGDFALQTLTQRLTRKAGGEMTFLTFAAKLCNWLHTIVKTALCGDQF